MMMSNNPMFLQEQDFQAKHSDLLQAAREGKAWEPRKFESVKTTWDALAGTIVRIPNWREMTRIVNIDTTDVSDMSPADLLSAMVASEASPRDLVHFVDRKIFVQTETQTIQFSEPCNPNEW